MDFYTARALDMAYGKRESNNCPFHHCRLRGEIERWRQMEEGRGVACFVFSLSQGRLHLAERTIQILGFSDLTHLEVFVSVYGIQNANRRVTPLCVCVCVGVCRCLWV